MENPQASCSSNVKDAKIPKDEIKIEETNSMVVELMDESVELTTSSLKPLFPDQDFEVVDVKDVPVEFSTSLFPDQDIENEESALNLLPEYIDSASEIDENEEGFDVLGMEIEIEEEILNLSLKEGTQSVQSPGYNWSDDWSKFTGVREEFHETVGPRIAGTDPLQLFTQIWDQPIMELLKTETNRYAWQTIAAASEKENGIPPHSRLNDWRETSVKELYNLFSIFILMTLCARECDEEYWDTGTLEIPEFRKRMSLNRYLQLMRFLHCIDNDELLPTADKYERREAKIKPIVDYLNSKFQQIYSPRRELSLDEPLGEAAPFEIKTCELCEANTGYCLNFTIYTGKQITQEQPLFGFTGSTAKTVITLVTDYLDKGYTLFMDKFYNSVALTKFLKSRKTDVFGTLNRCRVGTPSAIQILEEYEMSRYAMVSRHCGDVAVHAWKDRRLVTVISTYHDASGEIQRCGRDICTLFRSSQQGGVHLNDQNLLERKRGLKWYIKVLRRLVNVSIMNVYIIYRANVEPTQRKLTYREFRMILADQLFEQLESRSIPRQRSCVPEHGAPVVHTPDHKSAGERTSSKSPRFERRRCIICRTLTNIWCSDCDIFVCVGPCWCELHNRLEC